MASWVFRVCNLNGVALSDLMGVARDVKMKFRLNRPMELTFTVKADDPAVVSGSDPILRAGRVIKGYRNGTLRWAGYIWQTGDAGDEERNDTSVVCYGPFKRLYRRYVRDSAGNLPGKYAWAATQPWQVVRDLIQRTNDFVGVSGVKTPTAGPTLMALTQNWEESAGRRMVAPSILEICEASGLTFLEAPVEQTDGYLASLTLQAAITDTVSTVLQWGEGFANLRKFERLQDMEQLANRLDVFGSRPTIGKTVVDASSQAEYGIYEDATVYSDITTQAFIDELANKELALRKVPRELVTVAPLVDAQRPELDVFPWDDVNLGWLVEVSAAAKLRGGVSGQQRVWGWDLDASNDGVESVPTFYAGEDA